MDDLISRKELMEDLKQSHDLLLNIYEGLQFENEIRVCSAEIATFNEIGLRIKAAPTIDAEPVRHGRWEWYEDWGPSTWLEPPDLNKAGWKCSTCGIDLGDYLTDCLGVNVYVDEEDKIPKIKSCPHCGTKMDAKEG